MNLNSFLKKLRIRTIRGRLFLAFVIMAALATIGNTAGTFIVGYFDEQDQARRQLDSAALSRGLQISAWSESLQNELIVVLNEEYAAERITLALSLAAEQKYYDYISGAVRERFRLLAGSSQAFDAFALLDQEGNVVLSTDADWEGQDHSGEGYFAQGLNEPYVQLPFGAGSSFVIAARPVLSADMKVLGVLAGRAGAGPLGFILADPTGLGRGSKAFLVDVQQNLLAAPDSDLPDEASGSSAGVDTLLASRSGYSGTYTDLRGARVIGVGRWLPEVGAALLVEQNFSAALQTVFSTLSVNLAVTAGIILLAVLVSSFVSRNIANPLINLAGTAAEIAGGDLDRQVKVRREDEVGALAAAFNSMTRQLRDLVNNLEARVVERTLALQEANRSLAQQAVQLETSAQVSREITSILEIHALLQRVVTLIANAFGHDYVHIYLLDPGEKLLRLQASNVPDLNLPALHIADRSLNCEAVRGNRSIRVADASRDERFLADENLPGVRSELVAPLRFGKEVIGTLDVQSRQLNAFTERDELIFQSLADQAAIAIENARLYNRSRELATLEERTRLAKDLHDSVTQSLYSLNLMVEGWRLSGEEEKAARVDDYLGRTGAMVQQMLREMRLMIYELRPPALEEGGLLFALRKRLEAVESRAGIETHLEVESFGTLPPAVEEGLYLIAQEALNNTLKHARAQSVTVRLHRPDGGLVLEICDDGQGFDPAAAAQGGGYGLVSMRERAEHLGGRLEIESEAGKGTCVRVMIGYDWPVDE